LIESFIHELYLAQYIKIYKIWELVLKDFRIKWTWMFNDILSLLRKRWTWKWQSTFRTTYGDKDISNSNVFELHRCRCHRHTFYNERERWYEEDTWDIRLHV